MLFRHHAIFGHKGKGMLFLKRKKPFYCEYTYWWLGAWRNQTFNVALNDVLTDVQEATDWVDDILNENYHHGSSGASTYPEDALQF